MFKLEKNEFINGKCWYKDEYGNTAIMIRKETGFTAKIRFNDKSVTAKPFPVNVPPDDENGSDLHLDFPPGALEKEDIKNGIKNFTSLVQHWIDMLYDIKFLDCSAKFIQNANPGATVDDVNITKMERLSQNEELTPLISSVFSNLKK